MDSIFFYCFFLEKVIFIVFLWVYLKRSTYIYEVWKFGIKLKKVLCVGGKRIDQFLYGEGVIFLCGKIIKLNFKNYFYKFRVRNNFFR